MSTCISGVGKSSIITRYIKGDYRKECEATIGASFMYAKVTIRDYTITLKVILHFFKTSYLFYYNFFLFYNFNVNKKIILFILRYGIQLDKSGFVV